jgi:hypothetical protein
MGSYASKTGREFPSFLPYRNIDGSCHHWAMPIAKKTSTYIPYKELVQHYLDGGEYCLVELLKSVGVALEGEVEGEDEHHRVLDPVHLQLTQLP